MAVNCFAIFFIIYLTKKRSSLIYFLFVNFINLINKTTISIGIAIRNIRIIDAKP